MKISLTTKAVFGLVAIALMAMACTANAKNPYPTQTVNIPSVTETLTPSETIVFTATLTPSPTPEPTPTLEPTPVFSIDLTHNPVSTTDLSGQIRQENLSQDLGHLADQMLTQAETLGIDYLNVPILAFGQQWNSDGDPN
jgi:hypothetical protein